MVWFISFVVRQNQPADSLKIGYMVTVQEHPTESALEVCAYLPLCTVRPVNYSDSYVNST